MIAQLRDWRAREPDWHQTLRFIDSEYSRERYPGNCHIVPNHARVILALLYGDDDFQKSMTVVNTAGFDTDCNSGNVGCIMGIKKGLAGLDAGPDWRGPVADRPLPADGGWRQRNQRCRRRNVQTGQYRPRNEGRQAARPEKRRPLSLQLAGARYRALSRRAGANPKMPRPSRMWRVRARLASDRWRFAISGWRKGASPESPRSLSSPQRKLPIILTSAVTALLASPTLYPGQLVSARLTADGAQCR